MVRNDRTMRKKYLQRIVTMIVWYQAVGKVSKYCFQMGEKEMYQKEDIIRDLRKLGITAGDMVLMHSSFKALGEIEGGAKTFFDAFMELLGEDGTLTIPTLSFSTVTAQTPLFDIENTPSCVGYLTEYFRTCYEGTIRSMHPTHSCCAKGKYAEDIIRDHEKDITPVGSNSPFAKLPQYGGKILMLGCSTRCNTSMHGVEETAEPIYCINRKEPVRYLLKKGDSVTEQIGYRHSFCVDDTKYIQHYDRIFDLLAEDAYTVGNVLEATCYLMSAKAVWEKGHEKLKNDPLFFVDVQCD